MTHARATKATHRRTSSRSQRLAAPLYLSLAGLAACSANGGTKSTAGAGGASSGTGEMSDGCRTLAVLRDNCQSCHASTPLHGAPMPLMTIDDLRAHAVTNPARYVYEMIGQRIHDDQNPMPPPSTNDRLNPMEAAIVDAWIASGAPVPSDPTCSSTTASGAGGAGGAGGSIGSGGAGGTGPVGWAADCEQQYKLVAHGVSGPSDTTKFNVSTAPMKQFYECFYFKAPYGVDAVQALEFRPLIDDARVVHHWILYGSDDAGGTDGQVGGNGCSNGAFLAGWAPGGTGTTLPPDVGLAMPSGPNATLALEIHYNNLASYTDALDASGVEFCTTKQFRPNMAAVHWLGSQTISVLAHQTKDIVSTCHPTTTEAVHILRESPHMHQLGVHAKLVLNRQGGAQEILHDKAFAFADQQTYPLDVLLNPGDTLTTTCTFDNTTSATVRFGPGTENEMCYNFVTAYPIGGLSGPEGDNHCLGP